MVELHCFQLNILTYSSASAGCALSTVIQLFLHCRIRCSSRHSKKTKIPKCLVPPWRKWTI